MKQCIVCIGVVLMLLTACTFTPVSPIVTPLPSAIISTISAVEQPTLLVSLSPVLPTPMPVLPPTAEVSPPSPVLPPTQAALATPDSTSDVVAREAALIARINQVRAEHGLPPYHDNSELGAAARAHSCDMGLHGLISHTSSDGRTLKERLAESVPPWEWPSENIAAGIDDAVAVVALWMDEPPDGGHVRNILNPDQKEIGAGFCYAEEDATGNHFYWTADFARRG